MEVFECRATISFQVGNKRGTDQSSQVSQPYDLQLTTIFSPIASGKDMVQCL